MEKSHWSARKEKEVEALSLRCELTQWKPKRVSDVRPSDPRDSTNTLEAGSCPAGGGGVPQAGPQVLVTVVGGSFSRCCCMR